MSKADRDMLRTIRTRGVLALDSRIFAPQPTPAFNSLNALGANLNRGNRVRRSIWTEAEQALVQTRKIALMATGMPAFIAGPEALEAAISAGEIPERRHRPRATSAVRQHLLQEMIEAAYRRQREQAEPALFAQ